jgi:hypothetical protein
MVIKNLPTSSMLDKATVVARLGYRDRKPPEMVIRYIDEQVENALKLIRPVYSFQVRQIESVLSPDFKLEGNLYFSSKTVSYVLDDCREVAVYLATVGIEMDKEITRLFSEKQTMAGTILDTIGSIAIVQTLNQLRTDVRLAAEKRGLQSTRHYAPGYCDWDISQQRILFPVTEYSKLGVQLNEACMMIPRKSVSGVIGIGNIDKNKKTPCGLFCQKATTCEYRNT